MTTPIYFYKTDSLSNLKPNSLVALKLTGGLDFSLWVTDKTGIPYPLKDNTGGGGGTTEAIINTDGNLTITGTTTKTINVSSSLLLLINSALQSGDNISELVNDANYITLADIPAFVASDYDLEDFTNVGVDPYAHLSDLSTGITNLAYTASPTQGTVTSDTGTDATIPLADGTNAGLIEPSKYAILENTSGTNTGDQDLQSVLEKGNTTTEPFYNEFDAGSGNYVRSGVISILGAPFPTVGQSTNNSGQLTEMAIAPHANGGFIVQKTGIVNKKINFLLPDKTNILYPSPNSYTLATLNDIPSLDLQVPYTGATTNVDLGEYQLKAGQIEFDQTPTGTFTTGKVRWNDSDGTIELMLKGGNVTLQIGQEQLTRVVNKTGVTLLESEYKAVYISGAQGNRLKCGLAIANNDIFSNSTLGLVTENINNNAEGFVTSSGLVRGINTTGSLQGETWLEGDVLYLSPTTPGQLTNIAPIAPDYLTMIGYVVNLHTTQGSIYVKVQIGYGLNELHNVLINTPLNNNVLTYETSTNLWNNKSIPAALGYTPENVANKAVNYNTINNTLYPTVKATEDRFINKTTEPQTKTGGLTVGTNLANPNDKWIAFGTSVTQQGNYADPTAAQLNLTLLNYGVSGSTSNNLVSQYANIPTWTNEYRLLSIEHSINDVGQSVPLATFRANLEACIANAKGKGWPNNRILLINGNYITTVDIETFSIEAILIAKEQGVQYFDAYNYTKNNGGSTLLSDGVHPTAAGGLVYTRGLIASMQGGVEITNGLSVDNGLSVGGIVNVTKQITTLASIKTGNGNLNTPANTVNGDVIVPLNAGMITQDSQVGIIGKITPLEDFGSGQTGISLRNYTEFSPIKMFTAGAVRGSQILSLQLNSGGDALFPKGLSSSEHINISFDKNIQFTGAFTNKYITATSSGHTEWHNGFGAGDFRFYTSNGVTNASNLAFQILSDRKVRTYADLQVDGNLGLGFNKYIQFLGPYTNSIYPSDASGSVVFSSGFSAGTIDFNISNGVTNASNLALRINNNGSLSIPFTPTTSAGTYDFITRNTSTGVFEKVTSASIATIASPALTGTPTAPTAAPGTNTTQIATMAALYAATTTELAYALSDETSNLTVGTLITFRMPFAMTLSDVRISLNNAPTISSVIVDVKEGGVSIFSTLLSIDANEKTSVTAATPAVISDVNLADDAEITINTTQIGSGDTGKGLKILFKGRKA